MHPKVLSKPGWEVVRRLKDGGCLAGWTLCGGTGLALQLGHRYSEDLVLFRHDPFEVDALIDSLAVIAPLSVQSRSEGTLHVVIDGLRLSLLRAQAPLLFPGTPYRGLTLADPRDIAVMKVVAIGGRGSRKDFIDIYFCLQASGSLESTLSLLHKRFTCIDYNEQHLMKSLVWFEDAESEPMPRMIRPVSWEKVKAALVEEVRRLQA